MIHHTSVEPNPPLRTCKTGKSSLVFKYFTKIPCAMRSPEEILCEKERMKDVINILHRIKHNIPQELWWIMVQITVKKRTQTQVAAELNVTQSAVCKKIKKAVGLVSRIITIQEYNECFRY